MPTRFDPDLITKLDPRLHEDLSRQGFQVTGYRLELVGYQTSLAGGTMHPDPDEPDQPAPMPADRHQFACDRGRQAMNPAAAGFLSSWSIRMRISMTSGSARTWKEC